MLQFHKKNGNLRIRFLYQIQVKQNYITLKKAIVSTSSA